MSRLEIVRSHRGAAAHVELAGELALDGAEELEHALSQLIESEVDRVIVDLRGLDFMDSTGLSVLLRAQRAAAASDCRLALRPGNERIQRLFERSGTLGEFEFEFVDDPA